MAIIVCKRISSNSWNYLQTVYKQMTDVKLRYEQILEAYLVMDWQMISRKQK